MVGAIVAIVGSVLVGAILLVIYGFMHAPDPSNRQAVKDTLSHVSMASWIGVATFAGDWFFSALGGYVCARIARRSEYALGITMAAVSIVIINAMSYRGYSVLLRLGLSLATLAFVLIGVRIGVVRNARTAR